MMATTAECLHGGYHQPGDCPEANQQVIARERANALRAMADVIQANPELAGSTWASVELNLFVDSPSELAHLTKLLGGARTKETTDRLFIVRRDFGAGVHLDINANREEVCEAVVVGTETVEIPDPAAPKVTVERDVIKWRCAPILTDAIAGDPLPGLAEVTG